MKGAKQAESHTSNFGKLILFELIYKTLHETKKSGMVMYESCKQR